MTPRAAVRFVWTHGIVLEAADGPVPSLAAAIVGEKIRGSWWAHKQAHEIYRLLSAVRHSPDVLVCRLADGKVTFVHRRLWPALVRLANRVPRARLAEIREVHTASGKHRLATRPFPRWVPADVKRRAARLAADDAAAKLGEWFSRAFSMQRSGGARSGRKAWCC